VSVAEPVIGFGPFLQRGGLHLFERRNACAIADVASSIGYAKGEYRGLACRDHAMQAWPVARPATAALDPDLPIVDPDHRASRAG
jgi:hypothetical protein